RRVSGASGLEDLTHQDAEPGYDVLAVEEIALANDARREERRVNRHRFRLWIDDPDESRARCQVLRDFDPDLGRCVARRKDLYGEIRRALEGAHVLTLFVGTQRRHEGHIRPPERIRVPREDEARIARHHDAEPMLLDMLVKHRTEAHHQPAVPESWSWLG